MQDYEDIYQQGVIYLHNRDYDKAKYCFQIIKDDPKYRGNSLNALILIEIYYTNYKKARMMLEEYKDELYLLHTPTYANLEKVEFNLNKSLDILLESFDYPNLPNKKLLYLADLYLELGEYGITRKILETAKLNISYKITATIKLIFLDIIEGDYLDAFKLFQKITIKDMPSENYHQLKALIAYHLGNLQDIKDDVNTYLYYIQRLLSDDDNNLVKHLVERHLRNDEDKKTDKSYFFKNIDLIKLISDSKEQIKNINPNFDRTCFIYNLKFPNLVGYSNEKVTDTIKVVMALGTNKIITMYPTTLSDKYNQEGLRESKELKLKRGLKWKN